MSPVYMEKCDSTKNLFRFYEVDRCVTLFGDWAVACRWGRIGTQGRTQHDWFSSEIEAEQAFMERIKHKKRRGYSEIGQPSRH